MVGEYYNIDCMELMSRYPDKHFDLAIVDPEYGINAANMQMGKGKNKLWIKKNWDKNKSNDLYFIELFRISKKQIIWGGNYYHLPTTGGYIFWDKDRQKDVSFADGELAWTSFLNNLKKITIKYDGFLGADNIRIHPTQKPVKLYEWLLTNYAKPNDLILDTHCGSASSLIACENLGFKYVASELDTDYYTQSLKRLQDHCKQEKLFLPLGRETKQETPSMFA